MKKKHFVLDIISFIIIVFNVVSVICFLLPPGRAYYMPELLMEFTRLLRIYTIFDLGVSGIVGVILNLFSLIYKKKKQNSITNNIIYIVLFILTIPLAWVLFNAAMSV